MGAWGTGIFSDDIASDIRDEWRDAIIHGVSAAEAMARLLDSFDYLREDADNEKLLWIALAAAQMETGRLLPEARDRALEIIDGGGDLDRWAEEGDTSLVKQRERVLKRLAEKLRGPQPKPKRLRAPVAYSVPFDVGDVVRVRRDEDDQEALVVVIANDERERPEELVPIVAVLDWEGGGVPDRHDLARLPFVPDQIWPEQPLLIRVTTASKKEAFGPHLGEVVAKGLATDLEVDVDDVRHWMAWRVVPATAAEARLMARWRATPEGGGR
jgi:hypothetical protein